MQRRSSICWGQNFCGCGPTQKAGQKLFVAGAKVSLELLLDVQRVNNFVGAKKRV